MDHNKQRKARLRTHFRLPIGHDLSMIVKIADTNYKLISANLLNRDMDDTWKLLRWRTCSPWHMCFFSAGETVEGAAIPSSSARCQKAVHWTWTAAAPVISCNTDDDLTPITHFNPMAQHHFDSIIMTHWEV